MSPDSFDAVRDDEILWRRVSERSGQFAPGQPHPLSPVAFRPTRNDTTGISVFRSGAFQSPLHFVRALPSRPGRYFIVQLRAREVRALGIEVVASPHEAAMPGHVSLATLTHARYEQDRDFFDFVAEQLANLAGDSVLGPFDVD